MMCSSLMKQKQLF